MVEGRHETRTTSRGDRAGGDDRTIANTQVLSTGTLNHYTWGGGEGGGEGCGKVAC